MSPAVRVPVVATFAAALAVLLYPGLSVAARRRQQGLRPHPFDFALVAVATFAIAVVLVLLARSLARDPLAFARPAALGGAVIGYGAVLLFIALIIPATVECFANGGGSTSSQRWDQSGGGFTTRSSGSSTAEGVQTGTIESPSSIATYRCEQGRIVEFRREAR